MREFGFFVAMAFGLGLSVLVATPIMKSDIEAGDWLSFAGAMLGVGLAVLGALTVEDEKVRRLTKRNMVRLASAITKVEDARRFFAHPEAENSPNGLAMQLRHRAIILRRAVGALEHVVLRVDIDDVELWAALDAITEGIPELRTVLDDSIAYDWGAQEDLKLTKDRIKVISRYLTILAHWLIKAREIASGEKVT